VQFGQTGTSRTASTPSFFIWAALARPGLEGLDRRRAHERVVEPRERSDDAVLVQLAQAIERKRDVQVFLEARAVEVDGDVAHHEGARRRVGGDDAIVRRPDLERPRAAPVNARGGHDGDAPLGQRGPGDERGRSEIRQRADPVQVPLAVPLRKVAQPRHVVLLRAPARVTRAL
jgi:hypothetical protein